jgi:hypothetical protein
LTLGDLLCHRTSIAHRISLATGVARCRHPFEARKVPAVAGVRQVK